VRNVLIVTDGKKWFIRGVRVSIHDFRPEEGIDEMVYRCDKHLGGPYNSFGAAARHLSAMLTKVRFLKRVKKRRSQKAAGK